MVVTVEPLYRNQDADGDYYTAMVCNINAVLDMKSRFRFLYLTMSVVALCELS